MNKHKKLILETFNIIKPDYNIDDIIYYIEKEYKNNIRIIGEIDLLIYEQETKNVDIFEMKCRLTSKNYNKAKNQLNRAFNIYLRQYFSYYTKTRNAYIVTRNKDNTIDILKYLEE